MIFPCNESPPVTPSSDPAPPNLRIFVSKLCLLATSCTFLSVPYPRTYVQDSVSPYKYIDVPNQDNWRAVEADVRPRIFIVLSGHARTLYRNYENLKAFLDASTQGCKHTHTPHVHSLTHNNTSYVGHFYHVFVHVWERIEPLERSWWMKSAPQLDELERFHGKPLQMVQW